jgi:hypothetical protein
MPWRMRKIRTKKAVAFGRQAKTGCWELNLTTTIGIPAQEACVKG